MSTGMVVLIAVIALIAGTIIGVMVTRSAVKKQLEQNPPLNEDMLRMMMMQMGRKPSETQIHQMMQNLRNQARKANSKKK
ncbi:YneF family protein [Catellicoccus marimammalium]|uniref:UPF0154 protein C683_0772 n=1 Tax=Catellicoccus marimammalium M35/04/3 TaxID=1234409 RepID=K8ZPD8_9ENTE|nr:YneF family protein [Catellicoccus marimammalium]EKU27441.1 hypothetical protein C683_0772 [Catellicoccus marimammalium M35/04/3]